MQVNCASYLSYRKSFWLTIIRLANSMPIKHNTHIGYKARRSKRRGWKSARMRFTDSNQRNSTTPCLRRCTLPAKARPPPACPRTMPNGYNESRGLSPARKQRRGAERRLRQSENSAIASEIPLDADQELLHEIPFKRTLSISCFIPVIWMHLIFHGPWR